MILLHIPYVYGGLECVHLKRPAGGSVALGFNINTPLVSMHI